MSFLTAPRPGRYTFPSMWYSEPNAVAGMSGVLAMSELEPQTGQYRFPPGWPPFGGAGMAGMGYEGRAGRQAFERRIHREAVAAHPSLGQAPGHTPLAALSRRDAFLRSVAAQAKAAEAERRWPPKGWQQAGLSGDVSPARQRFLRMVAAETRQAQAERHWPPKGWQNMGAQEDSAIATRSSMAEAAGGDEGRQAFLRAIMQESRQVDAQTGERGRRAFLAAVKAEAGPPLTGDRARRVKARLGQALAASGKSPREVERILSQIKPPRGRGDFRAPPPALPGGAGATATRARFLAPGTLPQATTTPNTIADEHQEFGGALGDFVPIKTPSGKSAVAQGTWLSPSQVPAADLESTRQLLRSRESFGGIGQLSPQAAAQLYNLQQQAAALARGYVRPSTTKGSAYEGGAQLYVDPTAALSTAFGEGKIQLQPICDEKGQCIAYVEPEYVEKKIAAKIDGKSALGTGRFQLPGFYAHPQLGPWGVDPTQAYQYWAAQQAALEAGPYRTPFTVWGSPGLQPADMAPLVPAPGDSADFPAPGAGGERF